MQPWCTARKAHITGPDPVQVFIDTPRLEYDSGDTDPECYFTLCCHQPITMPDGTERSVPWSPKDLDLLLILPQCMPSAEIPLRSTLSLWIPGGSCCRSTALC